MHGMSHATKCARRVGPLGVAPRSAHLDCAGAAHPQLAGPRSSLGRLSEFTEEEGERVLEKGMGPEGEVLRPPMHIYHMNHADAKAIIAYLKSLPEARH
jgi:hypothetical protein